MNQEQVTTLLLDLDRKVSMLLERSNNQSLVCLDRRKSLDDHERRIDELEIYVRREQQYRKVIIGMLTILMGLVSWSLQMIPSIVGWFK